jgi:hypothetical protein
MKDTSLLAGRLCLLLLTIVLSCKDSSSPAPDCAKLSYTAQIVPLLNTYCTSCHNSTIFAGAVDLSTYDGIVKNQTRSLVRMQQGNMPPNGMPAADIAVIKQWIDCGALYDGTTGGTNPPPGGTWPPCNPDSVYFKNTIFPLVTSLCGNAGCHGANQPLASPSLKNYTFIKRRLGTAQSLNVNLKDMLIRAMTIPAYVPPDSFQLAILQKWIKGGARNDSCYSPCDTTQSGFSYKNDIRRIFMLNCTGCHNTAAPSLGIDLSTREGILAELAVNPGRLVGSIEWTSPYTTQTSEMPTPGTKLSLCSINQIKQWIAAGAPDN